MSDKKNRKDPFEEFFQRKAREYDISYQEEDWLRLEKKLDLRDAQISYRKRVRWIAAASLMIVSLLGYFTFENYNKINQISQQLSDNTGSGPEQTFGEQAEETENREPPVVNDELNEAIAANNTESTQEGGNTGTPEDIPETEATEPTTLETGNEPIVSEVQELNRNRFSTAGTLDRKHLEVDFAGVNLQTPPAPDILPLPVQGENAAGVSALRMIPDGRTDIADSRIGRPASSRFTLGLVSAPDLSTVGSMSNFYDPGYKLGITAEYDLGSNFSVSAGILQTMVRYTAGNNEYNPPNYWTNGIVPDEIIGECLLIDIPINIKFNFLNFNRSRFFASAGISSYIMLNEDYYFNYGREVNGQMEKWSSKTGTRHWASNAGFSVGYELDIHRNWSLRAEPFIKVPLREVGWGNVKLFSTGSFISIHHRL